MAVTASDVIEGDDIEMMVEEVRPQNYIMRRAFRLHDATGANSDTISFDELDLDIEPEEIVEVPEGASLPRAGFDQSQTTAVYTEYGFEVPITDKAVADGKLDQRTQATEQMAEAEEQRMDTIAGNVLESNRRTSTIDASGDASGTLEYADFLEARQTLYADGYNLNAMEIYADATAMSDILTMSEFTKASELGDYVVRNANLPGGDGFGETQAYIGNMADTPVYLANTATNLSAGQAYVVDTSRYGYESERDPFGVTTYREDPERQDVYQATGRYSWVSTHEQAAIKIDS